MKSHSVVRLFGLSLVILLLLIWRMAYLANFKASELKQKLDIVVKKIDSRFKYYDFELSKKYEVHNIKGKMITSCIDISDSIIIEYYKGQRRITPYGKALLNGEYRCKK